MIALCSMRYLGSIKKDFFIYSFPPFTFFSLSLIYRKTSRLNIYAPPHKMALMNKLLRRRVLMKKKITNELF